MSPFRRAAALSLFALAALASAPASADDSYIGKPLSGKTGNDIALVVIQGASSPPGGYKPVVDQIQQTFGGKMWAAVPQFIKDTPEPLQFGSKVDSMVSELKSA